MEVTPNPARTDSGRGRRDPGRALVLVPGRRPDVRLLRGRRAGRPRLRQDGGPPDRGDPPGRGTAGAVGGLTRGNSGRALSHSRGWTYRVGFVVIPLRVAQFREKGEN